MENKEELEKLVHEFCNVLATHLTPSNDTMIAIRLLREELPEFASLADKQGYMRGVDEALRVLPSVPSCPDCGGSGKVVVGENLVSLDMAIDAGDRSMAGMHHSWDEDTCPRCGGNGATQQAVEFHAQAHDAISKLKEKI